MPPREPWPREEQQSLDVIEAVRCIVAGALLGVVAGGILWAAPAIHATWPALRAWWHA